MHEKHAADLREVLLPPPPSPPPNHPRPCVHGDCCWHGRRNFKDTNPLMSSLLAIFVWGEFVGSESGPEYGPQYISTGTVEGQQYTSTL